MTNRSLFKFLKLVSSLEKVRHVSYIQGQSAGKGIREYFYYIDHQGMLFLDDSRMKNFTSCFKDKVFLEFFFKRLKINESGQYEDSFPFISLCGRERNFIRCDDLPIVYTELITVDGRDMFSYNHTGPKLINPFQPNKLFMSPESGRVYHPCHEKAGAVGLVISKLAIEFSKYFTFEHGEQKPPTHFTWNGTCYSLDTEWFNCYKTLVLNKNQSNAKF